MFRPGLIALLALSLFAVGCANYYIIKDPGSGETYFTKEYDQRKSGAVTLEDEKTGAQITVQTSEIREVDKDEYKAAMKTSPPSQVK